MVQIEKIVAPLAVTYTPVGTEPRALVHQWLAALAEGTALFADTDGTLKKRLLVLLKEEGIDTRAASLKAILDAVRHVKPAHDANKFTFIDLFAGIGGMRMGFQQAGGTCVFSSEFDAKAQDTYCRNHGDYPFGDITKINPSEIPDHDVLLGGFPCQPFSHAGLKLGIEDTRGTLFHDIAEILATKRPKMALLENVKGLISHEKGRTLQIVLQTLTSIGYSCNIPRDVILNGTTKQIQALAKAMVLKSIDFGVPQNRQRIYIVLWRDGLLDRFDYPQPLGIPTRVGDILEKNPDPKYTISDRLWKGHQERRVRNKENGKGFGYGLVDSESPYANTISARYYKDGSEILVAQNDANPRKLTPREAARLQGFPEDFQPCTSDVQAYKQFGNSVSVPVISAIANKIKSII
ncbi:DNA cytosine methyltransferase [Vogesella oryzae]|uniref:DNA cytosine methyltransferase n=1 Tax=Vogesella oryzae TaxID=1735285 RepID=UPI001C2EEED3|nr:DNA cytosine methyltransferase [Vogesella oryzae]